MTALRARTSARAFPLTAAVLLALGAVAAPASAAQAVELSLDVAIPAGPHLVGQGVPVRLTITNTGGTTASDLWISASTVRGSRFSLNTGPLGEYGGYSAGRGTLTPGQQVVKSTTGEVREWSGAAPEVEFTLVRGGSGHLATNRSIAVRDPGTGSGEISGALFADRDGDGEFDAGEGFPGVEMTASAYGDTRTTTTDADGGYRFTGLPLRVYALSPQWDLPDGWIVHRFQREVPVDGSGSGAGQLIAAVRPVSERLDATMAFTGGGYAAGDRAQVEITLTNTGDTDLTGVNAVCDRSGGEGPQLFDVDLGALAWSGPGVTAPAGAPVSFTISGSVPRDAPEHGAVGYSCDFGGAGTERGRAKAGAMGSAPGPAALDKGMQLFHDRNSNWTADDDELVVGVRVELVNRFDPRITASAVTDASGRVLFSGLPAGPYAVRLGAGWRHSGGGTWVGTCRNCGYEEAVPVLPA
ncbi:MULTISPECIES: hypothetical protein [Actinosynnema]|uniref:hypothetical protein n=1 Tax=Actinosynnema TaxID=40566 RepID=UPI0020A3170F|nr:hypothetical protein [Actinosynnema pretiosum]MCP2094583.1 hypothetical protein [Actinosynnema pretiosum]